MKEESQSLAHNLIRAFRQMHHIHWRGRRPVEGCTPTESLLLFVLRRRMAFNPQSPGLKASELGGMMRFAAPTVTQMVNVLEARGLVERAADPADRRVVRIRLTEVGYRQTQLAEEAMIEGLNQLIDYLGRDRAMLLIELLDDVYKFQADDEAGFCSPPGSAANPGRPPEGV